MRHVPVIAAAVLVLAAPAAGIAAGDGPPRLASYVDRFASQVPGTSSARHAETDIVNPADPNGKPPAISHVHVELAPGTVVNTRALPECTATDGELIAQGAAACPAASVVGSGLVDFDTGGSEPGRHIVSDIAFVNARNQLVFVTTERQSGSHLVVRGTYSKGNVLDVDLPPVPGTPPDGAADTHEVIDLKEGRGYLVTPPTCPASRVWTNTITYTFRDGVNQTFTTTTPCRPAPRPPAAGPLRVALSGVPRGRCVSRPFRVRAGASAAARQVTLYLDGRRLGTGTAARVPVRSLRAGRHRLKAIARGAGGRVAVARRSFRRC